MRSSSGVVSIQARAGSPEGSDGKKRRLISSGVPSSGFGSEVADEEATGETFSSVGDSSGGWEGLSDMGEGPFH